MKGAKTENERKRNNKRIERKIKEKGKMRDWFSGIQRWRLDVLFSF